MSNIACVWRRNKRPPEELLPAGSHALATTTGVLDEFSPAAAEVLAAVPGEIAEILQADVKGIPPHQLRQELHLLNDLLKAERSRIKAATKFVEEQKTSAAITPPTGCSSCSR